MKFSFSVSVLRTHPEKVKYMIFKLWKGGGDVWIESFSIEELRQDDIEYVRSIGIDSNIVPDEKIQPIEYYNADFDFTLQGRCIELFVDDSE